MTVYQTEWWASLVARLGEAGARAELKRLQVRFRWEELRQQAREDVNIFMSLCFRNDQEDGAPAFEQQWFHREWQYLWLSHSLTVLHGATGFGKTEQIIGHLLWRLGRNPKLRITILGKQQQNASKLLQKIKRQIENNKIVTEIFPELKQGSPWSTEKLRLATAGDDITTNNIEVYGLDGSPLGLRGDIIVADDVIDFENTRTEEQRKKLIEFFDTAIQSRMTTHGQLHILANAWHEDDLAFEYAKRPGVAYHVYPAEDPIKGALLWPDFRPKAWLDEKKAKVGVHAYARMYLCQPANDETRLFDEDWFKLARKLGQNLKPVREIAERRAVQPVDPATIHLAYAAEQKRLRIVVAIDLASKRKEQKRKSDTTCFFVVALTPMGQRQVLWAETGRWKAPDILRKMIEYEARYKPDRFVIESNALQIFLAQFANEVPEFESAIDCFETSDLKWDEAIGIEEIGIEMSAGRWILPSPADGEHVDSYLARLTPEERNAYATIVQASARLLNFTRLGHTADEVMAWYFGKEGIKRLLTGTFSHRNTKPQEQQQREQAGPAGTMASLFPAQPPALAPPSPYEPTVATREDTNVIELSQRVKALLGVA